MQPPTHTGPGTAVPGGQEAGDLSAPHQPHSVYNSVTLPAPDLHLQTIRGLTEEKEKKGSVFSAVRLGLSILCDLG